MTKDELKKEAEEFADSKRSFWRQGKTCIESVIQAYIASAEPREKQIADLEKENAELRKDKKELCHSISEGGKACVYLNEQLTKAKEIIREFMKYEINEYDGSLEIHFEELKKQAEQFLKDCEVEK